MIYGVILAGGKGERFWPLSLAERPKQFLKLISDKTMIEETINRVLPLIPIDNMRIVTGRSMSELTRASVRGLEERHILAEPFGRNTCAAVGLAAAHLAQEDEDAVLVTLSADHLVKPPEKLLRILSSAAAIAGAEDCLITIGIVPTRPETAYGYIKLGDMYKHEQDHVFYQVSAFTEKPKAAVAHEYYYSHDYLWNSGMFVWSARSILEAINKCQPDLGKLLEQYSKDIGTKREEAARELLYENATSISIDFAVLEKATNVLTVKADIIWDDIGGWNSLSRYRERDNDNNVVVGDALVLDSYESVVYNEGDGIITCLGVSDLIVVRSSNITLVVHKTMADRVKEILAKLEEDENSRQYL